MNLQSAKALSDLRMPNKKQVEPKVKTAVQVARRVFKLAAQGGFPYKHHTPESWAKKWLASKEFVLMEIDINAAASPASPKNPARVRHYLHCSVESLDPIVVDLNKRRVGKTRLGYIPEVVVHDGKHRKQAQIMEGRLTIMAWVGKKAVKKIKPSKTLKAAASNGNHNGNGIAGSITDRIQFMHAAVVPGQGIPTKTADTGVGGSRPVGILHTGGPGSGRKQEDVKKQQDARDRAAKIREVREQTISKRPAWKLNAGGPGSGRKPEVGHQVKVNKAYGGKRGVVTGKAPSGEWSIVKHSDGTSGSYHDSDLTVLRGGEKQFDAAGKDCRACGARSSGSLESTPDPSDAKIPPDQSDASQAVDASDQLKWNAKKSQNFAPGTGPGYVDQFGSPNFQAPGAGSGPRVTNKGASGSDMARELHARKMRAKGKKIKRIWDAKTGKYIDAVAPPGREDQVLKLKKKFGEKSAIPFKIAWSQHHGKD